MASCEMCVSLKAEGEEVASVVSAQEIRVVAELLQVSPESLQKSITFKMTVSKPATASHSYPHTPHLFDLFENITQLQIRVMLLDTNCVCLPPPGYSEREDLLTADGGECCGCQVSESRKVPVRLNTIHLFPPGKTCNSSLSDCFL